MTDVVSSILGPLVEKLASSAVEEIQLVCGVKDDREKLKNTLKMIQDVLADAEQRQIKEAAVRRWLSELKDCRLGLPHMGGPTNFSLLFV
ncbi:uncharacterized protein J3R85_014186 [Psidium guajava]|nr:uncharacterized protein J3R85_014186 [Psidium guajava]